MLAHLLRAHPAELRADFQRYYGLNIDGMGVDYSLFHAADLAAMLPQDSRCGIAEDPANEWTLDRQLLALIEYYEHSWVWAHTKDAKRKANRPKLRVPQPKREPDAELMTVDELGEFIGGLINESDGGGADGC